MRVDLPLTAWAVAGTGAEHAPAGQCEPLPGPDSKRRGGRAPLLATALCRRALAAVHTADSEPLDLDRAGVLFGTALGCLTETELFVEHMVEADEATPKPRAFSSSVHNAIASKVALDLGAHGECQTFVHGEVSFAHALFAAAMTRSRSTAPLLVGALDERSDYVLRGLEACGADPQIIQRLGEGGAAVLLGEAGPVAVTEIAWARPADPLAWLHQQVEVPGEIRAVPDIGGQHLREISPLAVSDHHASLLATATALGAGMLAGTVPAEVLGCVTAPDVLTLVGRSRFGDSALITLTRRGS